MRTVIFYFQMRFLQAMLDDAARWGACPQPARALMSLCIWRRWSITSCRIALAVCMLREKYVALTLLCDLMPFDAMPQAVSSLLAALVTLNQGG